MVWYKLYKSPLFDAPVNAECFTGSSYVYYADLIRSRAFTCQYCSAEHFLVPTFDLCYLHLLLLHATETLVIRVYKHDILDVSFGRPKNMARNSDLGIY